MEICDKLNRFLKKIANGIRLWIVFLTSYVWIKWKHKKSKAGLKSLKNKHLGEIVFIVASGPSLNDVDLNLLKGNVAISIQHSRYALNDVELSAHYWMVSDKRRICELITADRQGISRAIFSPPFGIPMWIAKKFDEQDLIISPEAKIIRGRPLTRSNHSGFSYDISESICRAGSLSIFSALQLAAYIGPSKVVLLGADFGDIKGRHHFDQSIPESIERTTGEARLESRYDKVKPVLKKYRQIYSELGIELYNASPMTIEDVLDKCRLEDAF
jgi:hypothetical protein